MFKRIGILGLALSLTACQAGFYGNKVGFSSQIKLRKVTSQFTTNGINSDVDVLFVVDNSQSTSRDSLGAGFNDLIGALSTPNWRIAITTTDSRKSETKGDVPTEGQDGTLVKLRVANEATGPSFIDPTVDKYEERFKNSILLDAVDVSNKPYVAVAQQYQEGIFSTYRALERSETQSFMRPGSNLAVIILSDEDELGNGLDGTPPFTFRNVPSDPTISNDLLDYVATKWGGSKNFNVHSIIVPPGDTACKNSSVQFGITYNLLSTLTNGLTRSICSKVNGQLDYTSHLRDIGLAIAQNTQSIALECEPYNNSLSIQFIPAQNSANYEVRGQRVYFSPGVPALTTLNLVYSCVDNSL